MFDKVKVILIDQLDAKDEAISLESTIIDDLGADSLDVVDLIMSIEEEFEIEVPEDQIEGLKTVGDIVKYIEEKTQ
ncbi:MAG: acyl carrier protein [Oscillospiraceae bacterium]|nr:acyl carrier protein [Oscillospiraceae bacterium]